MKRIILLAIAIVLILVASIGCAQADYYTLHEGTVCYYAPVSFGDDCVVFADGSAFRAFRIRVWDERSFEFKRDYWFVSDNITYSLVHRTDNELLLMPSNMVGVVFDNKNKDCGCK
jgi:hypothetical protein